MVVVYLDMVLQLNHLVQQGIVQDYPPLCDALGAMTAQFVSTRYRPASYCVSLL